VLTAQQVIREALHEWRAGNNAQSGTTCGAQTGTGSPAAVGSCSAELKGCSK